MQFQLNKKNKSNNHCRSPLKFDINKNWYKVRKQKLERSINDISLTYDKKRMINTNDNANGLYFQIKHEIKDIANFKNTELNHQKEKIAKKTESKMKEIALIAEDYISDKLQNNRELLCSYHSVIAQMNSLLKLYNDLQLKINAIRISNNALAKQVKESEENNKAMIKNVFYYKASMKQIIEQIKPLQEKVKVIVNEKEDKNLETRRESSPSIETNRDKRIEDKMIFKRINNNKKKTQLTDGNSKNQTSSDMYGTTTTSFNNQKSIQYVSHLYKTINTFNYKRKNIFKKELNTLNKSNKIFELIESAMKESEERYKKINKIPLTIYKKSFIINRIIEERGYRQMFIESIANNTEINQIMERKLFPELTAFDRIVKVNFDQSI